MNNFLKDFSLLVRLDIEDEEVTEDVSEEDSEEVNFCLSIINSNIPETSFLGNNILLLLFQPSDN